MVKRAAMLAALWLLGACTERSYVVGAVCSAVGTCASSGGAGAGGAAGSENVVGTAGSNAGGNGGMKPEGGFELDLTGSGVERLPQQLRAAEPSHFLVADDATSTRWPARVGDALSVADKATLRIAEPAPFADPGNVLSHSGATFSANSDWSSTGSGAVAVEVVFRAEAGAVLLAQRDAAQSLELFLAADQRLTWRLTSGTAEVVASSLALVPDAWHHCLALFDAAQGAELLCNGQPGNAVNVPASFALAASKKTFTLGDAGNVARVHWAELGQWRAATWGPRGAWTDVARERFTRLVGTYAAGATEPLPFADVRDSGAYIDMSPSDAPELRQLHPVGAHWARIVCRPTLDTARSCGLLVEAASSQTITAADLALAKWDATATTLSAAAASGPTGESTLYGLTPTATATEHALEVNAPLVNGPGVVSLFARPGSTRLLRVEVTDVASATFDLAEAKVVTQENTLLATAEPWGDGLLRLSFAFDVKMGPGRLRLALLDDAGTEAFSGDGSVAAYAGDAQLSFRSFSTPLPTLSAVQQADHLVYPAGNGNLAGGRYFDFSAEIWLPNTPLLADAAIVNANFAAKYDQQINLFVSPDGKIQFWGLQGAAAPWQLGSPYAVNDGKLHQVSATVNADGASVSIDGRSTSAPAERYDTTVLDRVEIGTSTSSSGPLTGIVRRLLIATPDR